MSDSRSAGTAYVVAPPGGGRGPGVLLLHAWWGLTPFFRSVADRLADEGFVVLAPDLFAGETAGTPDEAEALLAGRDMNSAAALVRSSANALRHLPNTPDAPIGVVGFSMGGSWALWLASRSADLVGAAVTFYGSQDVDFAPSEAAFLGHFAEHDEFVSEDQVVEMEAHLRLLDKEVDFHTYEGTGHWFFESDRPAAHHARAADLAWLRTVDFLHRHLDTGAGSTEPGPESAPGSPDEA